MLHRGSGASCSPRPCPFRNGSTRTLRTVTELERGEREKRTRHTTYLANELEAFPRANVPLPSLLDFGEYPRLDECATSDHDAVYAGSVDFFPVVLGGETVTAAKDGNGVHWGLISRAMRCWKKGTYVLGLPRTSERRPRTP